MSFPGHLHVERKIKREKGETEARRWYFHCHILQWIVFLQLLVNVEKQIGGYVMPGEERVPALNWKQPWQLECWSQKYLVRNTGFTIAEPCWSPSLWEGKESSTCACGYTATVQGHLQQLMTNKSCCFDIRRRCVLPYPRRSWFLWPLCWNMVQLLQQWNQRDGFFKKVICVPWNQKSFVSFYPSGSRIAFIINYNFLFRCITIMENIYHTNRRPV